MADDDTTVLNDEPADEKEATEAGEEKSELEKLKEAIEVATEDVGTLRKRLTISIGRDAIDERLDGQYSDLSKDALVPGFRKGRAPRRLIEKRFGSEVSDQVLTGVVGTGFLAAIEKEDLKVIGDPEVWVRVSETDEGGKEAEVDRLVSVEEAFDTLKLPDEGPMTFACEVEVRPEFKVPELDKIRIKKPRIEIDDDDVTEQVNQLLATRGTYEPVETGTVETDDVLVADLKITCDGTVLRDEQNVQVAARGQQVEGVVLSDLGDLLAGKKSGDSVTAEGELPGDYEKAEFRGKPATFAFTLHEIKRLKLPELTEAFVTSIGFESETELRDWVRADLESRLSERIVQAMRAQVYEYLLENTDLELPAGLSARQVNRAVMRQMMELYRAGVPASEVDKRLDELKTGARDRALKELRLSFIMDDVAEQLEVTVMEDEVNGAIASIAQRQNRRFDRVRDELAGRGGLEALASHIRNEKIVDKLLEKAEIVETTEAQPEKKSGSKEADKEESSSAEKSDSEKKSAEKKTPKRKPPPKRDDSDAT